MIISDKVNQMMKNIKIKLWIIKENIAMQNNRKRDYYEEKNSSTVSRNWLYL